MQPAIYVDMDGVICDFMEGLLWHHNRGDLVEAYEEGRFPKDWLLEGALGDLDNIWKPIIKGKEYFWTNLNPYFWAEELIREIDATAKDLDCNWYFCTQPYFSPESYSGKVKWIQNHFPGRENIIMMKDKYLLANEMTFLVDDNEPNCDLFEHHKGSSYLFPQPWNRNRGSLKHRIPLLRKHLNDFANSILVEHS